MNDYKYLNGQGEHVHLFRDQPLIGTSRVSSVLAKPLAWYGSAKAVEVFGVPYPKVLTKIKNKKATPQEIAIHESAVTGFFKQLQRMSVDDYLKLLDQAYRAHDVYMRKRAVVGTDLHAECEKFVRFSMQDVATERVSPLVWPAEIRPLVDWAHRDVKRFLWSEGHCYSEKFWLGGISDAGYQKKDGTYGILDFKSSKEAYIEQYAQCAGYLIQISENGVVDADGNLLYELEAPVEELTIFPFGAEKPQPQTYVDVSGMREMFLAELTIYKKLPRD